MVTVLKYVSQIRDIGQTQIGKHTGSSKQTVQKWFKGEKPIPSKYQKALEALFGFKVDFLGKELTKERKTFVLEREIERIKNSKEE